MSENIGEIIIRHLKENGFDGLFNSESECGCLLDDLAPCDYPNLKDCRPGYKHKADPKETDSGFDWVIGQEK